MKIQELKQIYHRCLDSIYGKDEVNSLFYISLEQISKKNKVDFLLDPNTIISDAERINFETTIEALKKSKPIQYIFNTTTFFGLEFIVNQHVLIPRQETEELIDWIISTVSKKSYLKPINILDIGTGSGCIAISLAKNLPNTNIFALDVSSKALAVAKENAELNGVNINFNETDILNVKWLDFLEQKFDVIVSNPPYVRDLEKQEIKVNVLDYEPHLALFVDDNNPLVFYKKIVDLAKTGLKPNGYLFFEINQYLGEETKALLSNTDFKSVELKKDLNTNFRMLKGKKQ